MKLPIKTRESADTALNINSGIEPQRKPRIVRIIARLVGGPARQACFLHEKLHDEFDTYLIIGSSDTGERDMSHLLNTERNLVRLPHLSRRISAWSDAKAFWNILRFLRRVRPDIVHTHTAKAGALGRVAAWMAGVPVIVHTYHGHVFHGYFSPFKTRIYLAIERWLGRLSTQIIAISESQLEDLSGKYRVAPRKKIWVVHNGFDLSRFSQSDRVTARKSLVIGEDDFVVAWVGRMAPVKGVELLANAIRTAADRKSRLRFLIVGDGTERPKLESLLEGCANFRLLGWRDDMETIWGAADAALLTSRNEGTPTALIEAMSAGVPFVATNVGAVKDVALGELRKLPEGIAVLAENGFLTQQTPEAVIHCLQHLADNPQIAQQMGLKGREFALQRFSMGRLVSELTDLYYSLLNRSDSASSLFVDQPEKTDSKATDVVQKLSS